MKLKLILILFLLSGPAYSQVTKVDILLSKQDFENLYQRRQDSKKFIPASLNIDGSVFKNANIRFKGNTSRIYSKKPIKIKFEKGAQIPQQFGGVKNMDCNAMFTDKSYMREKLVWDIFAMMNGFGPKEFGYVNLFFNGSDNGINLLIQHIGDDFFKSNGREEGDVYEAKFDDIPGNLKTISDGDLKRAYENNSKDENDYSSLGDLIAKLNNSSDADFAATVNSLFDMKTVYDWIILNSVTMNGDTYAKNYYLYKDPAKQTQQWSVIPWDYDLTFGRDGDKRLQYPFSMLDDNFSYYYDPFASTENVLKDRIAKDQTLREEFKRRLNDVLQNIFTEDKLFPIIDKVSAEISDYIKKEPVRWGTYFDFNEQAEALKYFVSARRCYLLATLFNERPDENDQATINVSSTGVPYRFIDHDGKMVAVLTFTKMSGLQKVTVHAYPSAAPPGMSSESSIKRYIEIIPYPAGASFTAEVKWEYINDPDLSEVGSSVLDAHGLESYNYHNGSWQIIDSKMNAYGNYVTIPSVNESNCGSGKYFALKIPDGFQQNYKKQANQYWQKLCDIKSPDGLNVFIVGDDGTMLKSQDAGTSWKQSFMGIHIQFRTVAPINSNVIYAGGMFGEIFKSSNGGTSWSFLNSGTFNHINCIRFRDEQNGAGVCDKGQIIVTNNSGVKWNISQVSDSKNLHALEIISNDEMIAGGDKGGLYKSNNGGDTWKALSSPTDKRINNLFKKGESEVYGVCDDGVVIYSTDKGESWKLVQLNTNSDLYSITFDSKQEIIVAGENGDIFHSSNGAEWIKEDDQYTNDLLNMISLGGQGVIIVGNSGTIMQSR